MIITNNQVRDYELRGTEFEDLNFLDFTVNTYEKPILIRRPNRTEESGGDDENNTMIPTHGVKPNSKYLPAHPKYETHFRVERSDFHNTLPSIVGPWFPRHDDSRHPNLYFASMLALLSPWRQLRCLKTGSHSWEEEYNLWLANTSERNRDVISGIQYYYDSKHTAERRTEASRYQENPSYASESQDMYGVETVGVGTSCEKDDASAVSN